jgi:predicted porin
MEKRKIQTSLIALGVAAALGTPLQAAAQDTGIQFYGHLDLSFDVITKGIKEGGSGQNPAPVGKVGWLPDISSNLSYVGFRGDHDIGGGNKLVFQVETQIDVSATPGPSPVSQTSPGNQDNKVQGALASRNSFLGIASGLGALKLGKTDAPYKLSTARMDPFSATIGDYNSIMGNTGGDNRAEFDTRLSHAMWYESPKFGSLSVNVLWAPGQNRASDNSINALGEPDCTGGGGQGAGACNDGSFGDAISMAGVYEQGPLYAIIAFEQHNKVNRTGDEGTPPGAAPAGSVDVANERAYKVGVQYAFGSNTIVNLILERMTRAAPDPNFNERQRNGSWLALTQKFSGNNELNLGWGHAGKTPGQPGGGAAGQVIGTAGPVDNASDLFSLGFKHHWDKRANWYAVFAMQKNHAGGHYDLGASGHGITTDCKDAQTFAANTCFTGETLMGVSVGMMYSF